MHRIFVLRAYGDFTILLQALLRSNKKSQYKLVASSHLQPLFISLQQFVNFDAIQIEFVDFGIDKTLLRFFTNKFFISPNCIKELQLIKAYLKVNPNKEGQDYLEQDKRIVWFNFLIGKNFRHIIEDQNVYNTYDQFFENSIFDNSEKPENRYINSNKQLLIFPDSRLPAKNIPPDVLDKIIEEKNNKGYIVKVVYFKSHTSKHSLSYNNFDELLKIIQDADFIIGADSLPIHLANLLNKSHFILYPKGFTQLFITPFALANQSFGTFEEYKIAL
jgi:ADP-heptose:LPS heptosyltransferase